MIRLDAAVTDTHALLCHAAGRGLGPRAAALFRAADARQAQIYVPLAVIWQVTLLARAGTIDLRRTPAAFFADLFSNPAYQPYDLTSEQVFAADAAGLTGDAFDGLIAAAAREMALPLITRDEQMANAAAVPPVW